MSKETKTGLALIGRALGIGTSGGVPKSILVLPAGEQTVTSAQKNAAGEYPQIECNVTSRSALHMEAARRQLVAQGKDPFFDYCHEGILGTNDRKSGKPTRFWWDPARGVMADVAWTDNAATALTGAVPEFDSFSPHVPIGDKESPFPGEALGLYQNCGGVVNIGTFGTKVKFSESADMQQLVAADPNIVAQIGAALSGDQSTEAAKGETMKELIAKLCVAFGLDVAKATEPELIAAFEKHNVRTTELVARDKAVIVALGFGEKDEPRIETLTGKIVELGKRDGLVTIDDHVEALTGLAVKTGQIAPAELETTKRRLKLDRVEETKVLIGKEPSVLLGKKLEDPAVKPADKNEVHEKAVELVAKDPRFMAIVAAQGKDVAYGKAVEEVLKQAGKL